MELSVWVFLALMMFVGALCKVGLFLAQFGFGAVISTTADLVGADLFVQLQIFLCASLLAIIATKLLRRKQVRN